MAEQRIVTAKQAREIARKLGEAQAAISAAMELAYSGDVLALHEAEHICDAIRSFYDAIAKREGE